MNESNIIPEDEKRKETKENYIHMCNSCIHKYHCIAAFKKDNWCGNYMEKQKL